MIVKIEVEQDKTLTVVEIYPVDVEGKSVKGLTPEQSVKVKEMMERAYVRGQQDERCRLSELLEG